MAKSSFCFNFKKFEIFFNNPLGSGAYGAVYQAKCDKLPCAAKILHSSFGYSKETLDRFRQECEFLESIKHPNIVQFLGLCTDPKSGQTALIMELMDESLTNFLGRHKALGNVPYHKQINISHDIVLALHYLHTNGIIHRDLSSNNVLLLGGCIAKVTDLGVSKLKDALQQQQMTQCPGSPVYMPPEALRLQPVYTEQIDSFSFGVLVIQIHTCRFPNPDPHEVQIADAASPTGFVSMPVRESDRRSNDIACIPDNPLKAIALQCIEDIPKKRLSSADLCDKLEMLKSSPEYAQSLNEALAEGDPNNTPSDSVALKAKDEEIELLKANVRHYQQMLENQGALESSTIDSKNHPMASHPHGEKETTIDLEPPVDESAASTRWRQDSGNTKVINGLNPDTVTLLRKDEIGGIAGVLYNDPCMGSITVIANTRTQDQLNQMVQKVMIAYQKVASTPSQLMLVDIPENWPDEELQRLIKEYDTRFHQCSFSYLKDISTLQVVSTNMATLSKVMEQLNHTLKYTIYFSDGRKFSLKKGDITKENVSVLVTATNPYMSPSGGMCKAVNIASKYKVENYCKEHVSKNGPLRECEIAVTPSGGDLKCRWIIHALAPNGAKRDQATCQRMMMGLITDCLIEGNKRKATSIAIPSIGTGHQHVSCKVAANAIITAIMDFNFQEGDSLHDISIVIIDDRTFNEFSEVFADRAVDWRESNNLFGPLQPTYDKFSETPTSGCRTQ